MNTLVSVIGGANVDLSATLQDSFIASDSNPGHVEVGYGGVARNIAHNLSLLGTKAQLLTIFGGDLFGGLLYDYCRQEGIDVHLSERVSSLRSGLYLCINNHGGEMIAAVADTEAMRVITQEWLAQRSGDINMSDFIIADTNIGEDAIRYLMEQSTAPLFIDGVSTTKAHRVVNALRKSKLPYLHTLKLNFKEALAVTVGDKNIYEVTENDLEKKIVGYIPFLFLWDNNLQKKYFSHRFPVLAYSTVHSVEPSSFLRSNHQFQLSPHKEYQPHYD